MLTDAQQRCRDHVSGPLFVSAGAGSGKTFTLQARVCQAFLPESGPYLDSLTQLLAITFTNAAARELQERIARALRKQGLSKQALQIDSAYISTIHSLCLRILHDNAFVFGVNPALSIVTDQEYAALKEEAFGILASLSQGKANEAYKNLQECLESQGEDALVLECDYLAVLFEHFAYRDLKKLIEDLLQALHNTKGGFDALVVADHTRFTEALFAFKDCADLCASEAEEYIKKKKPSDTARANCALAQENRLLLDEIMAALEQLGRDAEPKGVVAEEFLEAKGMRSESNLQEQEGAQSTSYAQILALTQKLLDGIQFYNARSASKEGKAAYARLRQLYAWLAQCLELDRNLDLQELCVNAARLLERIVDALMRSRGKISNDKLISLVVSKLQEHQDIAYKYQEQFKLALIDEFQDTDEMQFLLISLLVKPEHICTVGDAQQSIYKFRGADVSLFERVAKRIEGHPEGLCESLDINFRSHADILSFVRRVCLQESVFGSRFLDLQAGRDESGNAYKAPCGERIVVAACIKPKRKTSASQAGLPEEDNERSSESSTHKAAAFIAQEFARLRSEGKSARDMAVLLGALTHIDVYTQALRKHGFDCVLVGGKSFYAQAEVRGVCGLLRFLVNKQDSQALFTFLSADVLQLSTLEVLELMDYFQGKIEHKDCTAFSASCIELLNCASEQIRREGIAQSMQELLERLGLMLNFESSGVEGMAQKANVLKLLRIVADMETQNPSWGAARLAQELEAAIEAKVGEPQGSLNISGQEAVRIMSIHKSKGLEFDYVALAEFEDSQSKTAAQWTRARDNSDETKLFVALNPLKPKRKQAKEAEAKKLSLDASFDPPCSIASFEMKRFVKDEEARQEASERRRLLYVGMTRAREYLLICGKAHYPSKTELERFAQEQADLFNTNLEGDEAALLTPSNLIVCDPLFDEVRSALVQGDIPLSTPSQSFDFGGLTKARYLCVEQSPSIDDVLEDEQAPVKNESDKAEESSWHCLPQKERVDFSQLEAQEVTRPFISYTALVRQGGGNNHLSYLEEADKNKDDCEAQSNAPQNEVIAELRKIAYKYNPTTLGEAFHKLMELSLKRVPRSEVFDHIRALYGLDESCLARLQSLSGALCNTDLFRALSSEGSCATEMPFVCKSALESYPFIEGTFDLFINKPSKKIAGLLDSFAQEEGFSRAVSTEDVLESPDVCVIDYKLIMSNQESYDLLYEKYRLQASLYALALLQLGFSCVQLHFIVVNFSCLDSSTAMRSIRYSFTSSNMCELVEFIQSSS